MTGGRLKRLKKFIDKDETFMFTYGDDGVSGVNINKLLKFHKKSKKFLLLQRYIRPLDLEKSS